MISNINVARVEFQNRMDGVKQYMAFRKVGHELEARVSLNWKDKDRRTNDAVDIRIRALHGHGQKFEQGHGHLSNGHERTWTTICT